MIWIIFYLILWVFIHFRIFFSVHCRIIVLVKLLQFFYYSFLYKIITVFFVSLSIFYPCFYLSWVKLAALLFWYAFDLISFRLIWTLASRCVLLMNRSAGFFLRRHRLHHSQFQHHPASIECYTFSRMLILPELYLVKHFYCWKNG